MSAAFATFEHRRESRILRRLESADRPEVADYADRALADMLSWCKQRVPYYRRFLQQVPDAQIKKQPGRVLADNLPPLTRNDLHEHFDALTAADHEGWRVKQNATGGSTGEPVQLLQDLRYRRWNRAVLALFEAWAGWQAGQPKATLWGIPRDVESASGPVNAIRDRLLRRTTLNAYNMSRETMMEYAALMRRLRPSLFRVFTQSGIEFARFLRGRGETINASSVTCSGALLRPTDRALMAEAFNAPVRDSYGSREMGPIAAEHVPGGGLYVCPASHRVEILHCDGELAAPGEEGEIIVTLLINRVMPLLRYQIGDRGSWADNTHSAGAPAWPRIEQLVGRTMEHVVAADGTLRNSAVMTELVMHLPWIRRFQWIQKATNRMVLRLEPHEDRPADGEFDSFTREIQQEIRRIIGSECRLEIKLEDHIAPAASGKYHYVIRQID